MWRLAALLVVAMGLGALCACASANQQHQRDSHRMPPELRSGRLVFTLDPADQTVKTLGVAGTTDGFSFTGSDKVNLGDASIRVRAADNGGGATSDAGWSSFLTKGARPETHGPCIKLPCRASLNFTSLNGKAIVPPFAILREWENGPHGTLRLAFKVTNTGAKPLEIGGLGIAMPFAWAAGSDAGDAASTFVDPAITGDHGYVSVTRLSGKGEVLIITTGVDGARCDANKPGCRTSLEAWDVAKSPSVGSGKQAMRSVHSVALGGPDNNAREWLCHTKAYEEDWANASKPWLPPTSMMLAPGEAKDYVLLFSIADDVRSKDAALEQVNTALVHGVPGYILGSDMISAKLLVKPPSGAKLLSAETDTPSALKVGEASPAAAKGWLSIPLRALGDSRPRLTLKYSDHSMQVINYRTLPPFDEHIETYGKFQADTAFFTAPDPFRRSPSFMPWDRELNKTVLNDPRTFIVGLSDDAGAGANEGFASKMRYRPTQQQLEKLDLYINSTLWGKQLDGAGVPVSLQDHSSHGVRSSMFWVPLPTTNETGEPGYDYPAEDFTGWIWDRARANSLGRAYNYPHQVTSYWAMYHALRDNDRLTASQPWQWYLDQAARTITGMWEQARWYSQQGLMAGSVFKDVLIDLILEHHPLSETVRAIMYNRTMVGVTYYSAGACSTHGNTQCPCYNCTHDTGNTTTDCPDDPHSRKITVFHCTSWAANPFPFGSEFAWDSTGQEEDYCWGRYFGALVEERDSQNGGDPSADALANLTLSAVLAYVPSTPHWAYNGAAWSWGDTGNNAKWSAPERVAGHYRTTLNAIPMLQEYYLHPDDRYLLRPTIGAASLHMATIDARGAASMGFHLAPKYLELDPYSGDFGVGFYGHTQLAASIYMVDPLHGPLCYLCDATSSHRDGGATTIMPRDSIRRRVFIEQYGVLVEVMAGRLVSVAVDASARTFSVELQDDSLCTKFRLKVSTPSLSRPGRDEGIVPTVKLQKSRGAYELSVSPSATVSFAIGKGLQAGEAASNATVGMAEVDGSAGDDTVGWMAPVVSLTAANNSVAIAVKSVEDQTHCDMDVPDALPDQAHVQMDLTNAPDLPGFENGFQCSSALECSHKCADQRSADGWHRLACQAWTFVEARHSPSSHAWCWLRGGRGNAVGKCGYTTATCDNRPAPATDWPCCQNGFTCPDPMVPNSTALV